jgi:hypothetical protein
MLKKLRLMTIISATTVVALLFPFVSAAQAAKEIYYWVSNAAVRKKARSW